MEVEMLVDLIIPDTTAITAFHTLKKMGFKEVTELKREDYYKFDIEEGSDATLLGKIDILVNANKNRFRINPEKEHGIQILVQPMEEAGELPIIRERLGMDWINSMEKGVMWTLDIDAPHEKARETAERLAEEFFANKHYQKFRIIEGIHKSPSRGKALVIFGSKSDVDVYERIQEGLKAKEINHTLKIASAHKSPEMVDSSLNGDYDLIVSGAGLSAALPGVAASKTLKPVIGIPVGMNYQGLDALLSVIQMPPGIPVLGVGVDQTEEAVRNASLILKDYASVNLIGDGKGREKAEQILKQFSVPFKITDDEDEKTINIRFTEGPPSKNLVINVPSFGEKAEDGLKLMSSTSSGLWVGSGRGDNAALAAVKILNKKGKYTDKLMEYRKSLKKKIADSNTGLTYKEAGVDIEAGDEAVKRMKSHVKKTFNETVVEDIGLFGGLIDASLLKEYENPVLVSSIDGVGTKLIIAKKAGKWDSVGKDIVNHSANDILSMGAKPLFFLDYIASSKIKPEIMEQIVKGLSDACKRIGIPLIGGETAEMPDVYMEGEHDLAGCIVGILEKERVINGSKIEEGDLILGLESDGLHTNGFSLARKVLLTRYSLDEEIPDLGTTLKEELLKPHKSYTKIISLFEDFDVRGIAHITGGGIPDNLKRILPEDMGAEITKSKIQTQPIFTLIQREGKVPEEDMWRTFNMGIGMILVIPEGEEGIIEKLKELGINSKIIGKIKKGEREVDLND
jgi:phosphoribosylformylglycinamidine cyclo-ligase